MENVASAAEPIGLAEAIGRVRSELLAAQLAGASESLRFRLGEVRLEFAIELTREIGGEAGVKLWVVNAGAKGSVASTRTHTITVAMTPEVKGDDGNWVDAAVSDQVSRRPPVPASQR